MKRKNVAIVLAGITVLSSISTGLVYASESEDSEETYKVLYMPKNLSDAYCNGLSSKIELEFEAYPNIELTILDQGGDAAMTEQFFAQAEVEEYDGIILYKTSASQDCTSLIEEAQEAGIQVVAIDNPVDEACTYVGSDQITLGRLVGEYAAEVLPENAKILSFLSTAGNANSEARYASFIETLEAEGRTDIEVLEIANCDAFSKDIAVTKMEDFCQKYEQIDGVFGASDNLTLGAIQAAKSYGLDFSELHIFGIDGLQDGCTAVLNGEQDATCQQNVAVIASNTASAMYDLLTGASTEVSTIYCDPTLVTSENVEEAIESLKANSMWSE